ncbi:MAG: hypothetical protein BGO43_15005 [Gammaproteobacteria bacterium 39-13]|nr:MAG: hypothetical protein BGO43_15005 [Gammaproteobacteria bacterium 39-13]
MRRPIMLLKTRLIGTTLLLFTHLSSVYGAQSNKFSLLENRLIDNFKQFCLDNAGNRQKIITQIKEQGFPEEKNEYLKLEPDDHRWIIYVDEKQNTRVSLTLQKNTCTISAITTDVGHPPSREHQTPIESFLMDKLHATLVTRKENDYYEQRTFDAHYQEKAFTIFLRNEIHPAQSEANTFFYQIILRSMPQ